MKALWARGLSFAALGGVLLIATAAGAQPGPGMGRGMGRGMGGGMGPGHGPPLHVIARAVGLSDKQVAEIKRLSFAAQREAITARAQLQLARLELHQLMSGDATPGEGPVGGLVEKVGKLETQMKKIHVLRLLRIRRAMSLAQWRKLEAFQAQRRARGFGRGPGGGPGRGFGRPRPPGPPPAP